MEEREINLGPLFKWLTKRFDKKGKKVQKTKLQKVQKTKLQKVRKTRLLWESEFNVVKEGLDEEQVVAFVDNLIAQYKASQQASTDSLNPLLETTVTNAEQLTASIKMKAQAEAEAEAARIITQAKQEVQDIKLSTEIATEAKLATEKEAEDILTTVERKTEIIEAEAKQRTLLYLLKAREEIEKQIREDYKRAYSRLSSSLQDLMSEGQSIEVELRNKRTTLWESKSFELKEHEAMLLKASEEVTPPPETLVPEEKTEQPAQLQEEPAEEKTEQPVQLQEEVPEKETEQPAQLQEEPAEEKTEQPVQLREEKVSEKKTEQPAQLQEEPAEEKTEQPVQLQEEVPEKKTEQPAQLREEKVSEKKTEQPTQLKPADSQALYTGEVELAIAIPVELIMVSKLYNYLQTIPDIKILRTTGSWDRGTTITVVADKPIPLINIISEMPGVKVISELLQKDSSTKRTSSSPQKAGGEEIKRIKLTLKEAQSL